ncbi:hypothetical protein EVAR_92831_1 [Eumeta japonica]|uniref:C2H2-type domain-containing protein n=1 Tax=Eumeta variegata TaxID=151549 RepID=A0A4C1TDB0_EUMVA|nr:hypothetical protein EVAR_92831_1 [Eumeta japonica]
MNPSANIYDLRNDIFSYIDRVRRRESANLTYALVVSRRAVAHRGAMTVRCEVCRRCFEDDAELAAHDRTHTHDERAGTCSLPLPLGAALVEGPLELMRTGKRERWGNVAITWKPSAVLGLRRVVPALRAAAAASRVRAPAGGARRDAARGGRPPHVSPVRQGLRARALADAPSAQPREATVQMRRLQAVYASRVRERYHPTRSKNPEQTRPDALDLVAQNCHVLNSFPKCTIPTQCTARSRDGAASSASPF